MCNFLANSPKSVFFILQFVYELKLPFHHPGLQVVREGEQMLGRNSSRLAVSIFWFVTSSLVFVFTFLWRRFNWLVVRGNVNLLSVLVNVVAIERSILFVIWHEVLGHLLSQLRVFCSGAEVASCSVCAVLSLEELMIVERQELERQTNSGADPGFFLGGGALVSCSTSTPINHIVFFSLQNTSCIRKPQVISGGVVRTPCTLPLDPPL